MANSEKKRSANFTPDEVHVLRNEITKQYELLYGKITPKNTWQRKNAAWQAVLSAVNAVSPVARTIPQLKKKFKDIKRETRKKLAQQYKERTATGGGSEPDVDMDSADEDMSKIIGKASVQGIPGGGFDSLEVVTPCPYLPTQNPILLNEPEPTSSCTSAPLHFSPMLHDTSFPMVVVEQETQTNFCSYLQPQKMTNQASQTDTSLSIQEQLVRQGEEQLHLMRRQTVAQEKMVELFEKYLLHLHNNS